VQHSVRPDGGKKGVGHTPIKTKTTTTQARLRKDASAVSYKWVELRAQGRDRKLLTAKPMDCPCDKHEMEGLELLGRIKDCWYCCALQRVPWTPSRDIPVSAEGS
jgi:hypothetical protein